MKERVIGWWEYCHDISNSCCDGNNQFPSYGRATAFSSCQLSTDILSVRGNLPPMEKFQPRFGIPPYQLASSYQFCTCNYRHGECQPPRQQWILRDEQGHTMILSVQTKGRLRAAGWNHYSFKVLQWHSTKTQDSITFIHRFDKLKIVYFFFYNASGQEIGYAVLYWRT